MGHILMCGKTQLGCGQPCMCPTVSAGTTTALPTGSAPFVTNTGTSVNAIFNFGIPAGATGATGAAGTNGLNGATAPTATFWHDQSVVTVGAAIQASVVTTWPYAWRVYQASGLQNDSFYQDFIITAGTYTLSVLGQQNTNTGVQTWYIDGVSQGTMDWYRASALNTVLTLSVTIPSSPTTHRISSVVTTKNGSATAFNIFITKWWIS